MRFEISHVIDHGNFDDENVLFLSLTSPSLCKFGVDITTILFGNIFCKNDNLGEFLE